MYSNSGFGVLPIYIVMRAWMYPHCIWSFQNVIFCVVNSSCHATCIVTALLMMYEYGHVVILIRLSYLKHCTCSILKINNYM